MQGSFCPRVQRSADGRVVQEWRTPRSTRASTRPRSRRSLTRWRVAMALKCALVASMLLGHFLSVGGVGWRCKWCWSCCFQVHAVCGGALGQDIFVAHGAQRVVLVQAQGVLP